MTRKVYPTALTIAGSDSGGGAGIQADLKTFSALGVYGTSAITSITAQNTVGVSAILPIEPQMVEAQCNAVFSDIGIDAVKLGMLNTSDIIDVVADVLIRYAPKWIVLDPVMVATSGDSLIENNCVERIIKRLLPLAPIVTPNIDEAILLTKMKIESLDDMLLAAQKLLDMGAKAVLMKGGHLNTQMLTDILLTREGQPLYLNTQKIDTPNTHGTGCTYSSAIAAYLAKGENLVVSVKKAKEFIHQAIVSGADVYVGKGHGSVNHLFAPETLIPLEK